MPYKKLDFNDITDFVGKCSIAMRTCLGWCGKQKFLSKNKSDRYCPKCKLKKERIEEQGRIVTVIKMPAGSSKLLTDY